MIGVSHRRLLTIGLGVAVFFLVGTACANAQPAPELNETARAVALYQAGQNDEAIKVLRAVVKRNKTDLYAWHYLGLAWEKKGDANEARKAHEKAAKLGDQLLDLHLNQASKKDDILRAVAPIRTQLALAEKSSERYVALNPTLSRSKRDEWQLRTSLLHGLADLDNTDPGIGKVYRQSEVDLKVRVLS